MHREQQISQLIDHGHQKHYNVYSQGQVNEQKLNHAKFVCNVLYRYGNQCKFTRAVEWTKLLRTWRSRWAQLYIYIYIVGDSVTRLNEKPGNQYSVITYGEEGAQPRTCGYGIPLRNSTKSNCSILGVETESGSTISLGNEFQHESTALFVKISNLELIR